MESHERSSGVPKHSFVTISLREQCEGNQQRFEGNLGSFQKCMICEKEMISDANVAGYCRLCGMATEQTNNFCCGDCENKFKGWSSIWGKKKRAKRR